MGHGLAGLSGGYTEEQYHGSAVENGAAGAELEAQQRFESLFRDNPALMALSSLPDRRFLDVNDAFLKALGYAREDVIGRTAPELRLFPHPEQQARLARTLESEGRLAEFELEVRGKDGRILQGLVSGEVIGAEDKRVFLTVMMDITARKRVESDLKVVVARLTTLVENMQAGVLMEDPGRRLVFVNKKYCEIFGLGRAPADLAGADCSALAQAASLLVSDPAAFSRARLALTAGCKAVLGTEVEFKDGRVFAQDYVPICLDDGTSIGDMWKYMDITGRKTLEKLRLEVTHHVNHELRRPINAQLSVLEFLRSELGPQVQPDKLALLDSAISTAQGLARMVEDLIDVTRSETGKLSIRPEMLDLPALAEDMAAGFRLFAGEKGLAFGLAADRDLPQVLADPVRVRQVIGNLVDNAFKFTPGGGAVSVSVRRAAGGDMAEVAVADTGPGLDESELARVFDRLYQAKKIAGNGMTGLGLGLHICKLLVELQGGAIRAESGQGGSVFSFTLPFREREQR